MITDSFLEFLRQLAEMNIAWRNIQAQEDLVYWAKWMTAVSAVSAIGVLFALYYSRRGVQIAIETGREQSRAYVEAVSCDIAYLGLLKNPTDEGDREFYFVRLSVQNFGATPAKTFKVSEETFVRKY